MLNRYPHIARIQVPFVQEVTGKGIVGIVESESRTYNLKGRFENRSEQDRGYNAKFFVENSQFDFKLFENDNTLFLFEERRWDVVRIIPKQTHIEIWLN